MPNQPISLSERVVRSSDQFGTLLDGNVVLLSMATGKYYSLDAISSEIWRRIEEPTLVATLCAGLAAEYAADRQEVERDVLDLLDRLLDEKLIERGT